MDLRVCNFFSNKDATCAIMWVIEKGGYFILNNMT